MHELPRVEFLEHFPGRGYTVTGTAQVPLFLIGHILDKVIITEKMLYGTEYDETPAHELTAYVTTDGRLIFHRADLTFNEDGPDFDVRFHKYVLIDTKEAAYRFFTIRVYKHLSSPCCYLDWLRKIAKELDEHESFFFLSLAELTTGSVNNDN